MVSCNVTRSTGSGRRRGGRERNMAKGKKYIPVSVDDGTHAGLKAYADLTGIAITKVVANALKDWMETVGAARLEALTGASASGRQQLQGRVIVFPAPKKAPTPEVEALKES